MTTDADVLAAINVDTYPDGQAVNLEAIFGNSGTYDSSGALISARVMLQVMSRRKPLAGTNYRVLLVSPRLFLFRLQWRSSLVRPPVLREPCT